MFYMGVVMRTMKLLIKHCKLSLKLHCVKMLKVFKITMNKCMPDPAPTIQFDIALIQNKLMRIGDKIVPSP